MKLIKRIEITPPKSLKIGDPWYFERGTGENLVCDWKKLSYQNNVKAEIEVFEDTVDDLMTYNIVRVHVMPEQYLEEVHKSEGLLFFPTLALENKDLGCDTACFEIETDKGYAKIDTGADGYYGIAIKYKFKFGFQIEVGFDAFMADYEDVVSAFL